MSSSSFADSSDQIAGESPAPAASTGPFDFAGGDSHQFNSFSNSAYSASPIFTPPPPIRVRLGSSHPTEFASPQPYDQPFDASDFTSDGSILPPPPDQMQSEEGFALREWRRLNSIRLEEKEKMEKELVSQIVNEADEFKAKFHMRR